MVAPSSLQPSPRPSFRWGLGLLHAVIAFVIVIAVFGGLAAVLPVADPRRFGEGVGRFSFFMALGALGVSALAQTGRRVAAWVVGGLLAVLVGGLAMALVDMGPEGGAVAASSRPLPTDDLVRADGVLRHPSLGFSIPDPGASLQPDPAQSRRLGAVDPTTRAWVYANPSAGEMIMMLVSPEVAQSERSFTERFEYVLRGYNERVTELGLTADERHHSIRWSERRAHRYSVSSDGVHMRFDLFGLPGGAALMLSSSALTAERFAGLADGVKTH